MFLREIDVVQSRLESRDQWETALPVIRLRAAARHAQTPAVKYEIL